MLKYILVLLFNICIIGLQIGCSNYNNSQHEIIDNENTILSIGEKIFISKCQTCHAVTKTDFVLPNSFLYNDDLYWYQYLSNQDSLLKAKDPFTISLKRNWNSTEYTHQFQHTANEFQALKAFILSQ